MIGNIIFRIVIYIKLCIQKSNHNHLILFNKRFYFHFFQTFKIPS